MIIHQAFTPYCRCPCPWRQLSVLLTLLCSSCGSFIGLVATTLVIWRWTRDWRITALVYASLVLSSILLGERDVLTAPPLLLMIAALKYRRWTLATLSLEAATLLKWQPLILLPFVLVYMFSHMAFRHWMKAVALPALLVILVTVALFPEALISLSTGLSHPFLSGNALNINWLATYAVRTANGSLAPRWHSNRYSSGRLAVCRSDEASILDSVCRVTGTLFAPCSTRRFCSVCSGDALRLSCLSGSEYRDAPEPLLHRGTAGARPMGAR